MIPLIIIFKMLKSSIRAFSYSIEKRDTAWGFRAFLRDKNDYVISPWHNLDLKPNKELDNFTAFFEIPRDTTAKMEVASDETNNPVKQDAKWDEDKLQYKLRHYMLNPCFNYGMIPQTWENSKL